MLPIESAISIFLIVSNSVLHIFSLYCTISEVKYADRLKDMQMHRFDYLFLEQELLPAGLVGTAEAIGSLKARAAERKNANRAVLSSLEHIARVQSVKGSNALEGIITTDKRIEAIVNQNSSPLNHNESEIAGYRDALALVHEGHLTMDLRETDIQHLHEVMLSYTPEPGGRFKNGDNAIIETRSDGSRALRFEPVSATETPEVMNQLVLAYRQAVSSYSVNRILLIPCVVLDFLCIHPFWDGNGRISRLLSLLLLYKSGFDVGKYVSFEQQINQTRDAYYDALLECSQGWHDNTNSYLRFIQYFATTLLACYKELDKRFVTVATGRGAKGQRIEQAVLSSLLPISKQEIAAVLPDVSVTTIEAVLGKLVREGHIQKTGSGPATRYIRL